MKRFSWLLVLLLSLSSPSATRAQEDPATGQASEPATQEPVTQTPETQDPAATDALPDSSVGEKLENQVKEIGDTLDQSEAVQEVSAGILQPIYDAAEFIAFPAFYWIAFAMMVAGLISFAGQLVLTKLLLLLQGKLNLKEILGDLLALLICVVGLILTTQAATENSNFTTRPVLVVSSAAVGAIAGLIFWWWGQRTELDAARGAKAKSRAQD